jgi:hypothetical protein
MMLVRSLDGVSVILAQKREFSVRRGGIGAVPVHLAKRSLVPRMGTAQVAERAVLPLSSPWNLQPRRPSDGKPARPGEPD